MNGLAGLVRSPVSSFAAGVVLLGFWGYVHAGVLERRATATWDIEVRGRVTAVEGTAYRHYGSVQVVFEYTLPDGRRGRGVLRPRGIHTTASEALELRDDWKVGESVRGYANPNDPTEAVMEPWNGAPISGRWYALGAASLALTAYGLVFGASRWWAGRRARARSQAEFDAMMGKVRAHKARGGRVRVRVRER